MGAEESRPAGARGADADLLGGALKGWGVPAEWQGAPPQPTPAADDDLRVSADVLRQAGVEEPARGRPEGRTRPGSSYENPEEKEARRALERAARGKTRLDQERQRHKSPARGRASAGSSTPATPGSRYLSEGSDSEDEPVFVDGITTIQSAMDSSSYSQRMKNRFWEIRERTDLEWRSLQGNQVDTFFDKYERQDILQSERSLVSVPDRQPMRSPARTPAAAPRSRVGCVMLKRATVLCLRPCLAAGAGQDGEIHLGG